MPAKWRQMSASQTPFAGQRECRESLTVISGDKKAENTQGISVCFRDWVSSVVKGTLVWIVVVRFVVWERGVVVVKRVQISTFLEGQTGAS